MGWIIVQSADHRMVFNQFEGWVDRDAGPGPTVFPEQRDDIPVGAEWEKWDG